MGRSSVQRGRREGHDDRIPAFAVADHLGVDDRFAGQRTLRCGLRGGWPGIAAERHANSGCAPQSDRSGSRTNLAIHCHLPPETNPERTAAWVAKLAPDYAEAELIHGGDGLRPGAARSGDDRSRGGNEASVNAAPSRNAGALRIGRPEVSVNLTCLRRPCDGDEFAGPRPTRGRYDATTRRASAAVRRPRTQEQPAFSPSPFLRRWGCRARSARSRS